MKKSKLRNHFTCLISIITVMVMIITGCGSNKASKADLTSDETKASTFSTSSEVVIDKEFTTSSEVVIDKEFTARDLDASYEDSTATHITFDGNNTEISGNGVTTNDGILTISKEGTYVFTGTLNDGQIVVDAKNTDKIHIVLNGVSITCSDNAPIYIKNADKTFITLVDNTENFLTDGTEYVQVDDKNVDGVIFSASDLTMNGGGILTITGNYKHGIVSKDNLVITGGSYHITAKKDALNGRDCVKIKDGTFHLSGTNGNGIQSKNGDDTTKGYVYICGGNINITKCREGIEGTVIIIDDGTINITAEDDGLNSSSGNSSTDDNTTQVESDKGEKVFGGNFNSGDNPFKVDSNCYISISSGTITVDAAGDGIDTNGNLFISGGTVYVSGPTNSGNGGLDYNGTANITGGTIIVTGSSGMAQGFSDSSTQYSILNNFTSVCEAGTEVTLTDNSGNIIVSYTPNKQYKSVVISTPELKKDATYILTCGNQTSNITLSSVVTSNGTSGMGNPMGDPGMGGSRMGGKGMNPHGKPGGGANPPKGMQNDNGFGERTPQL